MDAVLLLAAEESSQTGFYVAGLVLAVFAVVVAAAGIASASFSRAATPVMALGAVLAAGAMAAIVLTA
jgi:hypothetical protein